VVIARWMAPLAVMTVLLTASCGQPGRSAPKASSGHDSRAAIVPFSTFLASLQSASYRDFAGQPQAQVRNERAFDQMRAFLLAKYDNARVVHSFTDGSAVFDCTAQTVHASPPPPADPPAGSATATASASAAAQPNGPGCPVGSIPVQRLTLTDLVRFPTLTQYLGKSPGGPGGIPPIPPAGG